MKLLFTSLILCMVSLCTLVAQTPFDMVSSHANEQTSALSASSLNNPWVGAKLGYNVSGDVSESFLLSARVMYVPYAGDRFAFPVVGNVGLNNADSTNADNGVSIGVFPYYSLSAEGDFKLLLHGGLNYHILTKADAGEASEFRILAGLEAALYGKDGGPPTTLSIAPEAVINTGPVNDTQWGLDITGVLPVAKGLGLLAEGWVPFQDNGGGGFSIGVIVNSSIK